MYMEGSRIAKAKGTRPNTGDVLHRGGLPARASSVRVKAFPRVTGLLKRDGATAKKVWHTGNDRLARLPKKAERKQEQKSAAEVILSSCRRLREDFLKKHADAIYRKLTKNLSDYHRVEELAYDVAKMIPGLTPDRKQ